MFHGYDINEKHPSKVEFRTLEQDYYLDILLKLASMVNILQKKKIRNMYLQNMVILISILLRL
jgi:hypothetical protein